ncbi:MAG: DNA-binding protein [Hirschia sp.]|nr:DNA-binding protein [Hirschia sp.]MBF17955.1 DNA-binding protein [Hirschia sp.]|tara:strand:+ start:2147 stop:2413 length:267 start_codon:yes stop_codon:yes gene_type:complete
MNKSELCKKVAESAEMTQSDANRAIDAVLETIAGELKRGEQVALAGFGTFVAKTRKEREGRNPATGKPIKIPAKTSAAFKPATALKDL